MNGTTGPVSGSITATNGGEAGQRSLPARAGRPAGRRDSRYRKVLAAWERFAAGDDAVAGVRPEILLSWYRCREEYKVDPRQAQAPPAGGHRGHSLEQDTVFTELGGLAAAAAGEFITADGLVTVTDCDGRILASFGEEEILRAARESNLAPWASWSEQASGTNGMGTSLESHQVVTVEGPEHWCQGFHGWSCGGIAIRDVITGKPLAVLNVSRQRTELAPATVSWLQQAADTIHTRMRERARESGTELLAAFSAARPGLSVPVAALDAAGKVVIANEEAAILLGVPPHTPATDPRQRWTPQIPALRSLAALAARQAQQDRQWVGATELFVPFTGSPIPVSVRPVFRTDQLIGMVIAGGAAPDDPVTVTAPAPVRQPAMLADRVIGRRGTRLVLLTLPEIRYAESDGNTIWLTSDQGRLPATTQGLDNLEQQLAQRGFLRVHRRYLVNLRRIKEIEQGFKGSLFVVTDVRSHETIPVSRRHAPGLRRALGM